MNKSFKRMLTVATLLLGCWIMNAQTASAGHGEHLQVRIPQWNIGILVSSNGWQGSRPERGPGRLHHQRYRQGHPYLSPSTNTHKRAYRRGNHQFRRGNHHHRHHWRRHHNHKHYQAARYRPRGYRPCR
ncbi:hypothetical protein [Desulfogranum mediterraneum]|uniref:hypothetical protein n=1 Tax=Desulfogranum mediterraneum TaxID=160661 RepID=UPI00048EB5C1|nr:hypothetical protein [Desulfogranum mediterraneum]